MVFVVGDILPPVSFSGLAIVAAVAFLVPLLLGLVPQLRLPSAVVEIVAGIVIGPSALGWVKDDIAIEQRHLMTVLTGSALIATALLSSLLFPGVALTILGKEERRAVQAGVASQ